MDWLLFGIFAPFSLLAVRNTIFMGIFGPILIAALLPSYKRAMPVVAEFAVAALLAAGLVCRPFPPTPSGSQKQHCQGSAQQPISLQRTAGHGILIPKGRSAGFQRLASDSHCHLAGVRNFLDRNLANHAVADFWQSLDVTGLGGRIRECAA